MEQFRVKGLSCANCTQEMEKQINKLDYGESATLSYNSGRLSVDSKISLVQVARILSQEGAYLEQAGETAVGAGTSTLKHAHGNDYKYNDVYDHNHDQMHGDSFGGIQKWLIGAALIYVITLLAKDQLPDPLAIGLNVTVMIISGYRTWFKGFKNLLRLHFNIDTLMTVALTGAVSIGQWEEAALVALLFGLNELLEGLGMEKARRSMESLLRVAPKEAIVLRNGEEVTIPIDALVVGDKVYVRPGDKIPSDGTVYEGRGSVNEAAITGESFPVEKLPGASVFGGSLNNEGLLKITITKTYKDSSLARILHLVEEAQETKTPTPLCINRFAQYYTPLIMLIAVIVALVPPLLFHVSWKSAFYQGLAVLIVGCPCALILSSPIAIVAGLTRNARNGILIKGGVFLEQLGKINTIAFDKTGTLTQGEPSVESVAVYDAGRFYRIAAAIEKHSSHPLAKAIVKYISWEDALLEEPSSIEALPGRGIFATIKGQRFWLGHEKSMEHIHFTEAVRHDINRMMQSALTVVMVADDAQVLGIFGIADPVRAESRAVIAKLHQLGIQRTVMLTGDHHVIAEKAAKVVGIKEFQANLLPQDKVAAIHKLALNGHVAMIGDGINDAPALAAAQLGIAMGKGTDSAMETADIILLQDHLGKLPEAIVIAKRMNRLIKWNISITLGLKLAALLLTIPGLLTLWIAVVSDMGATVLVSLLSLTLLLQRNPHKSQEERK
jgi:Zn2+/Cd2+-exporting ATPase